MALLVSVEQTRDPDIFWHLRVGQVALSQRTPLPVDLFSYSSAGAPWPYKDLLADGLLYAGFACCGFLFFALLKVLTVAFMTVAYQVGGCMGGHAGCRLRGSVVCVMGLVLGSFWLVERPNLFSMMLFPFLLVLMERARHLAGAKDARTLVRAFAPLVLLQWGWACLHRASLLGFVLIFALSGSLLLARMLDREPWMGPRPSWQGVAGALLAAVFAVLLGLLNPCGAALFRTGVAVAGSQVLRRYISEWQRIDVGVYLRIFPAAAGLCAIALFGLILRLGLSVRRGERGPVDLWHGGLLLLFSYLCLDSVRWTPYFMMTAALCAARLLGELEQRRKVPGTVLCLCGALLLGPLWLHRAGPLSLGEAPGAYPAGAVAFAREHHLGGKVVNPLVMGGYLIWHLWPQALVLVDGRNDTVYPPDFVVRCLHAKRDAALFAQMRQEDGATWAVASNDRQSPSFEFLSRDPAWSMVYWSEEAVIYVLRARHPELEEFRFRFMGPSAVDLSVEQAVQRHGHDPAMLQEVRAEIGRMVQASPDGIRANIALCLFYHLLGPEKRPQRDAVMRHLLQVAPRDPAVQEFARNVIL